MLLLISLLCLRSHYWKIQPVLDFLSWGNRCHQWTLKGSWGGKANVLLRFYRSDVLHKLLDIRDLKRQQNSVAREGTHNSSNRALGHQTEWPQNNHVLRYYMYIYTYIMVRFSKLLAYWKTRDYFEVTSIATTIKCCCFAAVAMNPDMNLRDTLQQFLSK